MIDSLDIKPNDKVLEIGTGSGYNAAIIARLCQKMISLEKDDKKYDIAKKNLQKIMNIDLHNNDGTYGFAPHAPYDKMIMNIPLNEVPHELVEQLSENGILIYTKGDYVLEIIRLTKIGNRIEESVIGHSVSKE